MATMTGYLETRVIDLERKLAEAVDLLRAAQSAAEVADERAENAEDRCGELGRRFAESEQHVAGLERAGRSAIDELRRWQYADDIADVRHSIDIAIRTLERA